MVSVGDEEPAMVVANLRKALAEIDELSAERASIEEALKEERNRDNILPKLMASSGRSDNIFVEEIKKYDELKVGVWVPTTHRFPHRYWKLCRRQCNNVSMFWVNISLLIALHLVKFHLVGPSHLQGVPGYEKF